MKFDFLAVLQKAVALIESGRGIDIDLAKLPLDDAKSYELLGEIRWACSSSKERVSLGASLKRLKPDRFEGAIIAMVTSCRQPWTTSPSYTNESTAKSPSTACIRCRSRS